MTTAVKSYGPSREEFSDRLLKGSVKKSYEPVVDIDWDAPLDPDKFYLPATLVSLYGTPMWDEMTREQQIELSRQELANTLSAGIWFENTLNQALLRTILHEDPTSNSTHYKLTELGDETRPHGHVRQSHRAHRRQAGPPPVVPSHDHQRAAPGVPAGLDAVGRRPDRRRDLRLAATPDDGRPGAAADDPAADADSRDRRGPPHPIGARHGARKRVQTMPRINRWFMANINGLVVLLPLPVQQSDSVRPDRFGRLSVATPCNSPHRHEVQVAGFAPLAAFLTEVGLLGPIARRSWKRCGFL